jgi:FAD/FMN-containing dehydrogenase
MAESNVEKKVMAELMSVLGPNGWIKAEDAQSWSRDWLDRFGERPLGVARPITTAEVSAVLRVCYDAGIPIVPQGGNTGLVGASVLDRPGGIILSLGRMNKIISKDPSSRTVVLEPGVVLENLHNALDGTGLIFPMHLGSQGSAQIGGLIATNAGGSHAFRYGMMQDLVVGIEVVLADGSVWDGLRQVQKDNSGYQLRKLFCGSEGTLGVITRAVLKLSTTSKQKYTALMSVDCPHQLVEVSNHLKVELGDFLSAMEFFSSQGLEFALKFIPDLVLPLDKNAPYYFLCEVDTSSTRVPLEEILNDTLMDILAKGLISECVVATSESQSKALWRLREEQPEGQRLNGVQLKNDLSIPLGRLADFLEQAKNLCNEIVNGVIINPFGHLGDGNVHFNLSPPNGQTCFNGMEDSLTSALGELVSQMNGSFAAEHGLGRTKIKMANTLRSVTERNMMGQIKKSLDPHYQLNKDVIVFE